METLTMNDFEPLSGEDGLLLVRHREGDEGAFAELVAEYRAPVYSYLVRFGIPAETRDDLFQEIFLKVHRAADRYRPSRPLQPWLFTIVANTVRNHLRARRVRQLVQASSQRASEPVSREVDGERVATARQQMERLRSELGKLPAAQREALLLCCVEGMAQGDVAASLGIPVNTLKTRLRRARLTLARALADGSPEETT